MREKKQKERNCQVVCAKSRVEGGEDRDRSRFEIGNCEGGGGGARDREFVKNGEKAMIASNEREVPSPFV